MSESSRSFNVESVRLADNHRLTTVAIESEGYFLDRPEYVPLNWKNRLCDEVEASDVLCVEYFPPEIAENVYDIPFIGRRAKNYVDEEMRVYTYLADIAELQRRQIMTADIATKPRYLPHEFRPRNLWHGQRETGPFSIDISPSEQRKPTATDARRVFTARAIQNIFSNNPDGVNVLYVGAPAHVNRVRTYVAEDPTLETEERFRRYQKIYRRLDQRLRIYEPKGGGWTLISAELIM